MRPERLFDISGIAHRSITDGRVTSVRFGWLDADNPGLASMNGYIEGRRGFPIHLRSIEINADTFSETVTVGDVVLVRALRPTAEVKVKPASDA